MKALKEVIESFEYNTDEIENVLYKPYLVDAIISTVAADTTLPESFVKQVIDLIYLIPEIPWDYGTFLADESPHGLKLKIERELKDHDDPRSE